EPQPDGDAVEDQRLLAFDPRQHDGAATEAHLPIRDAAIGWFEMRQQGDMVRTGYNLERCYQDAPPGIPFDIHFSRIDRHGIVGRIAVDDVTGTGAHPAAEKGWQPVPAQFALQFTGEPQIGTVSQVLQSQRQQDVRRRDLVGANIDRTHTVGGGADRDAKRPCMTAIFANAEGNAAATRAAKAEADVFELPFVAALLIVDNEVAVLQTDFV